MKDEIIRMAREAGGESGWDTEQPRQDPLLCDTDFVFDTNALERFAALVAAAEREACAKRAAEYFNSASLQSNYDIEEYINDRP